MTLALPCWAWRAGASMGEFDLIERYFKRSGRDAAGAARGVDLGIGDDCALLSCAQGMQLAISSDMLVEGRHFLSTVSAQALGHKALAVNLSDLAACGARPLALTLALSLPRVDEAWLAGFSEGLFALADEHGCTLIGGDTTAGPLTVCISVFGHVPQGQALLRSGAKSGDDIYVSGTPGCARLALEVFRGTTTLPQADFERMRQAMERPVPRVALGQALRGLASSAIDVSDGLLGDLSHVLKASAVGAEIDLKAIDAIASGAALAQIRSALGAQRMRDMVLAGGDDYELVFTAAPTQRSAVQALAEALQLPLTRIGQTQAQRGLCLREADGSLCSQQPKSFDHFKSFSQ